MGAQRDEPQVPVERQLGIDQAAAGGFVGEQAFGPLADPSDRAPGDLRRPQHQAVFGIAAALGAESAAHVVADDAELALRQAEYPPRQGGPDGVHRLDRTADGIAVLIGVVVADAAARLHGVRRNPVDADPVADHVRGPGDGRLHCRPVADLVGEGLVARIVVPDGGRAGRHGVIDGDHRRQGRVIDGDPLGRVLRLREGFGDDEGDRLADEADAVLRQQGLRADIAGRAVAALARHRRQQGAEPAPGELRPGEHGEHAGRLPRRRCVDRHDAGMGVRRAQDDAAGLPGGRQVVHEPPPPLEKPEILLARHGIADADHVHGQTLPVRSRRHAAIS